MIKGIVSSMAYSLLLDQGKLEGETKDGNKVYTLDGNVYCVDRITKGVIATYSRETRASELVGQEVEFSILM